MASNLSVLFLSLAVTVLTINTIITDRRLSKLQHKVNLMIAALPPTDMANIAEQDKIKEE